MERPGVLQTELQDFLNPELKNLEFQDSSDRKGKGDGLQSCSLRIRDEPK